ncbi:MAG: N-acetylmuramoyl-L-alanine amidase [Prolixibacteraceae bacterium]|jgi:N-acetylmuramoyl-L-alanine amidase|nr:N-acetylmuramoyl-L-alanine amidase [Prolixibacteraceae bacterium]
MNYSERKNILIVILLLLPSLLHAAQKEMIVIIDPGHGGKDAGAIHSNIREKDVVLNIGLKLGQYINEQFPEVKIIYTRNTDIFVPLHQRAAIANRHKADLFISIHANYCGTPSTTGTETFILGLHRSQENLDVAKKENSVILFEEDYSERYEGFDPNLSESYIMFELIQDEFLEQSAQFANQVQNQFRNRAGRKDRGVKQAGFLVLRQTGMPSVLIEAGFLSNTAEAKYLASKNGQDYIASAIFRAFSDYKKIIDSKSEFTIADQPGVVKKEDKRIPEAEIKTGETNKTEGEIKTNTAQLTRSARTISEPEIYFSLQIAASQREVKPIPANFRGLNGVRCIKIGNVYKYYAGKENSPERIEKLKNEVRKKYPDAFIVAFQNNHQIPVSEALQQLKNK